jgi:hypothetical protein
VTNRDGATYSTFAIWSQSDAVTGFPSVRKEPPVVAGAGVASSFIDCAE